MLNNHFQAFILKSTGAKALFEIGTIQSLWSGYGNIVRYGLMGSSRPSVVVKHVQLEEQSQHPRGWNSDISHRRKIRSYQVEMNWYRQWSSQCNAACRVPECLGLSTLNGEVLMILEDLDSSGFAERKESLTLNQLKAVLAWLAQFHATFMQRQADGLWEQGTYWHLETRPDEWQALTDNALKQAASAIDQTLRNGQFQTIVHGDAKLANFCFSSDGLKIAAVDCQYVGGGCGMKDVAYFLGSCLDEESCHSQEAELLDCYFDYLHSALETLHPEIDRASLIEEWRYLYPYAWTDFHRFLKGWSPGHWKINSYSEQVARNVLNQLNQRS